MAEEGLGGFTIGAVFSFCTLQFCNLFGETRFKPGGVCMRKVLVFVFVYSHTGKVPVEVGRNAVPGQRLPTALEGTTVEHDDWSSAFRRACGGPHQRLHVAPQSGDAGHLGDQCTIHAKGEMVGQLRRAGAAGAGVDEWSGFHVVFRPPSRPLTGPHRVARREQAAGR